MAARKTQSKKAAGGALAKRQTVGELALPSDLADEFGDFATRDKASATQTGGIPWVSTQGSSAVMKVNMGGELAPIGNEDGSLDAIVLGGNRANMYFDRDFEPGVFTPPACYAVASRDWLRGEVEEKLAPPADLGTKQADRCKDCRWNAFGSASRGRGKACSNTVRLMLIPDNVRDVSKADGIMLSVPPTSLANWGKYVTRVTDGLGRPVSSVITRIRKVPSERGAGFSFSFELKGVLDAKTQREELLAIAERVKGDARQALEQPPPAAVADEDDRAPSGGKKTTRRKVVRRGRGK